MHHKRHRPKHRRAGCLFCKPHKRGGQARCVKVKGLPVRRRLADAG